MEVVGWGRTCCLAATSLPPVSARGSHPLRTCGLHPGPTASACVIPLFLKKNPLAIIQSAALPFRSRVPTVEWHPGLINPPLSPHRVPPNSPRKFRKIRHPIRPNRASDHTNRAGIRAPRLHPPVDRFKVSDYIAPPISNSLLGPSLAPLIDL